MSSMKVYFVRHGRTVHNQKHMHQSPDVPLSSEGEVQADKVGMYLETLHPDFLVSSTYTRAQETAGIISKRVGLPVVSSEHFGEIRRPAILFGRSYFSPLSLWYFFSWYIFQRRSAREDRAFELGDMVQERIVHARTFLEHTDKERVVVVSHALFINLFIRNVCHGKRIGLFELISVIFRAAYNTRNGGVTTLTYDKNAPKGTCAWQVEQVNYHEHLKT